MIENAAQRKYREAEAFKAINAALKDFGVPCSDTRISDALVTYAADYGLSGDDLLSVNRRFLAYLTDCPEQAIRRYVTESVTLTDEAPMNREFSEERSLAAICRLLHDRGIERDHDEIREAADKKLRMRPKLKHLQGVYEELERMLTADPTGEFSTTFGRLKIAAGWSRLAFANYIEKELTR